MIIQSDVKCIEEICGKTISTTKYQGFPQPNLSTTDFESIYCKFYRYSANRNMTESAKI